MTNLQEVPTDDLLSFQDYPTVHTSAISSNTTVSIPVSQIDIEGNIKSQEDNNMNNSPRSRNMPDGAGDAPNFMAADNLDNAPQEKSFWSLNYYQKYFDVDTRDVIERIVASLTPKWDNSLKHHLRSKPDLYGPFWISVTLVFTIAISGNVANYLQHASTKYHWKYDFHVVSYAATTIFVYVTLVPFILWGLLKATSQARDIEGLEDTVTPGALELICIYGYSLFLYIPISILWTIQINMLRWILVFVAAFVSGSVLLLTLMPALRLSKQKFFLSIGIIAFHLLLGAGFVLYFFHVPDTVPVADYVQNKVNSSLVINSTEAVKAF